MKYALFLAILVLSLSSCRKADVCLDIDETALFYQNETIEITDCTESARTGEIDWGDGRTENYNPGENEKLFHTYSEPGAYIITATGKRLISAVSVDYEVNVYGHAKPYIGSWNVVEVVEAHTCGLSGWIPQEIRNYSMTITGDEFGDNVVLQNFGDFLVSPVHAKIEWSDDFLEETSGSSLIGQNGGIYDINLRCLSTNEQDFLDDNTFELFVCVNGTVDGQSCNYNSKLTFTKN